MGVSTLKSWWISQSSAHRAAYLIVTFLVLVSIGVHLQSPSTQERRDSPWNRLQAIDACEREVSKRLVAPASAEFADVDPESVSTRGISTYVVRSYVDAQNRMGAMLRMRYSCRLELLGDTAYRALEVSVHER